MGFQDGMQILFDKVGWMNIQYITVALHLY